MDLDSPLQLAVLHNNLNLVSLLLSRGADVQAPYPVPMLSLRRDEAITPLHVASLFASLNMVHLLLLYGADVSAENEAGGFPMDWAQSADAGRDNKMKGIDKEGTIRLLREAEVKDFNSSKLSGSKGKWDENGVRVRVPKTFEEMLKAKEMLGGLRLEGRYDAIWGEDLDKREADYWWYKP